MCDKDKATATDDRIAAALDRVSRSYAVLSTATSDAEKSTATFSVSRAYEELALAYARRNRENK